MKLVKASLALGVLGGSILFALGASAQSSELPDGPGKALASENCSACHGLELVTAQRRSPEEWEQVVNRMIANGDTLTEDQYNEVVAYLGTYLGPE
jgi:mono/diheme cytochrome c family protein